jgi:hypothetical protein
VRREALLRRLGVRVVRVRHVAPARASELAPEIAASGATDLATERSERDRGAAGSETR